jgi:hypothetical protein
MSKQGTDLDLLRQFQIYEAVLQHEDGEQKGAPLKQLDETIRYVHLSGKCMKSIYNNVHNIINKTKYNIVYIVYNILLYCTLYHLITCLDKLYSLIYEPNVRYISNFLICNFLEHYSCFCDVSLWKH